MFEKGLSNDAHAGNAGCDEHIFEGHAAHAEHEVPNPRCRGSTAMSD